MAGDRWYCVQLFIVGRRFPVTYHTWADDPDQAERLILAAHTPYGLDHVEVEEQHR